MKSLVTFILILIYSSGNGLSQEFERIGFTQYLSGSGTISVKHKVRMSLNLIEKITYSSDGCLLEVSHQIVGYYNYEKNGGSINLFGEIKNWHTTEGESDLSELTLYEFNEKFEKIAAFKGVLNDSTFSGTWSHLISRNNLPFDIRFDNNKSSGIRVNSDNHTHIVNSYSNQSQFTCLDKFAKDKNLILLFQVIAPYCGYYNCRGVNCGSSLDYLYLFIISNGKLISINKKLNETVDDDIEKVSIEKNKNMRYVFIDGQKKYSINYENPSLGIIDVK